MDCRRLQTEVELLIILLCYARAASDPMRPSPESLKQILCQFVDCSRLASTPSAMAKRVSAEPPYEKCTAEDVERVLVVLEKLPYVQVLRKPSGRIAGLQFVPGTEGACSLFYVRRSPGETLYYHGSRLAARVPDKDDFSRNKAAEVALRSFAQEHRLPVLDFLRRNFLESIQPFVSDALVAR